MTNGPFRITTAQAKVGYVVGATVVEVLLALLLFALGVPDVAVPFLAAVGLVAMVVVGVRVFRGDDEPVAPPRAWWRMTARPFAGFLLAAYFVADGVLARSSVSGGFDAAGTVVMLLVAAAYLGSSVTLLVLRSQGRAPAGAFRTGGAASRG
ncbi:hypothetical protein BIU98_08290 [Curtobacterium sp. MMLR14_010]|uniref:hypothetical protein n=1 Tax=Curtobacterium sp. MMLR14_010 TaxID=1898743 RepID=UPI0008DC5E3E|nr:hypothetical protein [Curtobacterium sp. MMLR14_010]OII31738.1 hypothetical protein BIU98_08290 [Curtobacterium sp. MMLR14_010]